MTCVESSSMAPAKLARHLWAVYLAGGSGARLRGLTAKIVGDDRPKQYCPIASEQSLLSQTRSRLMPLFLGDRQVFVVCRSHERYYGEELADAQEALVIAQPANRGTAVGVAAALLQIMQCDPDAIVGLFPCDHHYSDDECFRSMVRSAAVSVEQFPKSLVLVGAEAEYAETEYGWIEPGPAVSVSSAIPLYRVNRFWEKPELQKATALLRSGCLWNTFVTMGRAATFLELLGCEVPEMVLALTRALADQDMTAAYGRLPIVDFSSEILSPQAKRLLVLRDCGSGWTDLGSPGRVLRLLAKDAIQPAWARGLAQRAETGA